MEEEEWAGKERGVNRFIMWEFLRGRGAVPCGNLLCLGHGEGVGGEGRVHALRKTI